MKTHERILELGLTLPEPSKPGGNYVSVNIRGEIAYLAIQFPKLGSEFKYQGRLGSDLTTEEGYQAARLCALNVLAHINKTIGFENIVGLNHLDACYLSDKEWQEAPKVVDGASDLFIEVLGERGIHSRGIFGADKLPRNFCVGITCSFTIKKSQRII